MSKTLAVLCLVRIAYMAMTGAPAASVDMPTSLSATPVARSDVAERSGSESGSSRRRQWESKRETFLELWRKRDAERDFQGDRKEQRERPRHRAEAGARVEELRELPAHLVPGLQELSNQMTELAIGCGLDEADAPRDGAIDIDLTYYIDPAIGSLVESTGVRASSVSDEVARCLTQSLYTLDFPASQMSAREHLLFTFDLDNRLITLAPAAGHEELADIFARFPGLAEELAPQLER